MAVLTATEVAEVRVRGTYGKSAYRAVVERVLASGESEGNLETEFPLVKPAHVAHMFRGLIEDGEPVSVAKHANHGICLIHG